MRLTPQEIANSKDQNLIEDWIGEATNGELHKLLEHDVSHAVRTLVVGKITAIAYKEAMESHKLIWWIFRSALAIVILAAIGFVLRWLKAH